MPSPESPPEPVGQLMREHREIEARVDELERAVAALAEGRAGALATINGITAFFAGAAARHHEFEENTLFPRLRELDEFAQMIPALEFQHKMNDDAYVELCAAVRAENAAQIAVVAPRFADMHRAHIMAEERALFPLLATAVPADVLAELSAARG